MPYLHLLGQIFGTLDSKEIIKMSGITKAWHFFNIDPHFDKNVENIFLRAAESHKM